VKTTIQILIGVALLNAAHADTVYLNNVSAGEIATFTPGIIAPTGGAGLPSFFLQDDRLISSITIQRFFVVFDAHDQPEVTPTMWQAIFMTDGPNELNHFFDEPTGAIDTFGLVTPTDTVELVSGLNDDESPMYNQGFRQATINEAQTWSFGFNVLAYDTVPEPSTLALVCGGLLALYAVRLYHNFRMVSVPVGAIPKSKT
jgi:hypothetical protein